MNAIISRSILEERMYDLKSASYAITFCDLVPLRWQSRYYGDV